MMYKYDPQALQQLGMQQQPFDHSAGIGEFERRQFQPYNQPEPTPRPFDPSAGIGEFESRQFQPQALQQLGMQQQPYQQQEPQALQQMGMRQQSYRPLPQMPVMQPLLQQFRTQQRPYQSPYQQGPYQGRFGQMSPDNRSGSAYSYNNNSQLNKLAPLNMNALNFRY